MKTIVFDVDDTIYDQQKPFEKAIRTAFPHVKQKDIPLLYLRFRFYSDETFPKVMTGEWTLENMRYYRMAESLKDLNYPTISQVKGTEFQTIYEVELANIQMHEEIRRIFDFLVDRQIPIGIITNGPTEHQTKKVKQLQLENWVPSKHIIISQSTGFQKPEKEIFDLAAQTFGMDPRHTLYVGDSYENDICGAHNGGWQSLWFNHRLRPFPTQTEAIPLNEVTSFESLFLTIHALFSK